MRAMLRFAVVSLAVVATGACESPSEPGGSGPELTSLPRSLSVAERQVIQASNTFAFDILRETVRLQPKANTFLSPLSASLALGMTMNGARGETLDGMRNVLGFGDMELPAIQQSYRDLIELLLDLDDNVDMRLANSIWARQGFPFHDAFLQTNRQYFDAHTATLDFSAANASATINQWVDEHTGGKIKEIVPNPIPAEIVMYLINAVYFKGDWRERFDRADTRDAPFTLAGGSKKTVRMMKRVGNVRYHEDAAAGVQIIELPYSRGAFAMTIVLPAADADVNALVATLDAQRWNDWTDRLTEKKVDLSLPRFRLEYETVMNDPLITLGMGAAFRRAPGTDFTGMSPRGLDLYISEVKQKTFVDVNEDGTEAAAATSVGVGVVCACGPQTVVIDRPFVVALRERFSGTILFLGTIGSP